jgi:ABC-type nitrate/sulfonate/bicarbonate transport system permease component
MHFSQTNVLIFVLAVLAILLGFFWVPKRARALRDNLTDDPVSHAQVVAKTRRSWTRLMWLGLAMGAYGAVMLAVAVGQRDWAEAAVNGVQVATEVIWFVAWRRCLRILNSPSQVVSG